ncbi:MAG: ribosome biogenesis protein [Thaumarchaeota archaeon]|nr:ribosome biogenesis protein [Nitrososphaerota archaeon]
MLSLILAESSLELVPKELQAHNSIVSHCKKVGKKPSEILLDNSWHFAAMKGIKNELKRGRPDLVHISLLAACSTPLYLGNKIRIYIHTINDNVIVLGKEVRIPKSYHRFAGVIEQLFKDNTVKADDKTLFELKEMNFDQLLDTIKPEQVIGLSTEGTLGTYESVAKKLGDKSCIIIGGFQKGHFSNSIKKRITDLIKINENPLESHVVIGRILYEYEKTIFM